jgi:hypothetical protein
MLLAAGGRWSFRGKDAGSVRIGVIRARLRTPPRGEQRGRAAQPVFRQALLSGPGRGSERETRGPYLTQPAACGPQPVAAH